MYINNHWLTSAQHCPSPNYNEYPDNTDISLIVIHCISLPPGQFGNDYINQLFCNKLDPEQHPYFRGIVDNPVSAHVLVRRNGDIVQYVAFNKRAWHAGLSAYQTRRHCNDFSIGIELEGTEDIAYEMSQYQQLAALINVLLANYPSLSTKHITGHSNIALDRKTDPGDSFDWQKCMRLIAMGRKIN